MANTKRRTNVSLDLKLFKRATEYGRENGRSLSSLIEQGLRGILDGTAVQLEHTNLAPAPPPDRDALRGLVRETFLEILESDEGQELMRRSIPQPVAPALPEKGVVDVPPEIRERLQRYTPSLLAEALGMDRTVVSKIRSGARPRITKENLEKLVRRLEELEQLESLTV